MKIRPVGAELFHADKGRTDRHDNVNRSLFVILRTRLKMCSSHLHCVVPLFPMTYQVSYNSQQRSPLQDFYRPTSFVFEEKCVFWPIWFVQPPASQIVSKALFAGRERHCCLKVPTILYGMVGVFLHFFTGLHVEVLCYKDKFTARPAFTLPTVPHELFACFCMKQHSVVNSNTRNSLS